MVAMEVRQEHGLALLEWELEKGLLDARTDRHTLYVLVGGLAGVGEGDRRVVGVGGRERVVWSATYPAAEFVFALVGGDAEEPTAQIAALEALNRAVGRQERFLRGVFGGSRIADEAKAQVVDRSLISLNETVECVETAVL